MAKLPRETTGKEPRALPPVHGTIPDIRQAVAAVRAASASIGLVPTMGALHAGHARLIETARQECGFVVVSIFVNPTQFGPGEDFDRYPRSLEADRELCGSAGADAIFAPPVEVVYPGGFRTSVEVRDLQDELCGASRPGHFRGVCTVVVKLLNIVQPDVAYFGQKDAQQALILRRMIHDLNVPVDMRVLPTVREADGLALSSRNRYLSPVERAQAPALWRILQAARQQIEDGERDPAVVERVMRQGLAAVAGARVDYARVVSVESLTTPARLHGDVLVALAASFGATRLIDNFQVHVS